MNTERIEVLLQRILDALERAEDREAAETLRAEGMLRDMYATANAAADRRALMVTEIRDRQ